MSTTPNVPEVTVNTPAPEIAAANVASQTTPTPGQPAPAPAPVQAAPAAEYQLQDLGQGRVKVQYATGEVFEGTNQEIIDKIAKAHVQTKQWAKSQVQPVPVTTAPVSRFASPDEKQAADYVAHLLGFPNVEALENRFGFVEQNTSDYASQTTAMQFQAMEPSFNQTPENSEKLLQVISAAMPDEEFGAKSRDQQVQIMRQAHSYCVMNKIYDPKPANNAPASVPAPPPPAPGGRTAAEVGSIPANLVATMNDTPEQIKAKWDKARELGLA